MARRHKPTGNYSGVLATPMQVHRSGARIVEGPNPQETRRERESEAKRKIREQLVERVVALFKHYSVERGDFATLTMKLAQVHVPGFKFREPGKKGRGRPSGVGTAEEVIERVEQFREIISLADKLGFKRACEIISERRGSRSYGVKPATLRKMVTDAKLAPTDDKNGFAFRLAQSVIDIGIVGALFGSGNDEDRADTEVKGRVRRK